MNDDLCGGETPSARGESSGNLPKASQSELSDQICLIFEAKQVEDTSSHHAGFHFCDTLSVRE